ncbi:hypothetical protein PSPO01_14925 [Paraphaeosphaeria sporulosa]
MAPALSTFTPNPVLNNQKMYRDASSTLGGATSPDVRTGLGHPGLRSDVSGVARDRKERQDRTHRYDYNDGNEQGHWESSKVRPPEKPRGGCTCCTKG